jgi:hypothetical protein
MPAACEPALGRMSMMVAGYGGTVWTVRGRNDLGLEFASVASCRPHGPDFSCADLCYCSSPLTVIEREHDQKPAYEADLQTLTLIWSEKGKCCVDDREEECDYDFCPAVAGSNDHLGLFCVHYSERVRAKQSAIDDRTMTAGVRKMVSVSNAR